MKEFEKQYPYWRDEKLKNATTNIDDCFVEIKNPQKITKNERGKIIELCKNNNFVLIQILKQNDYAQNILSINKQLGLIENDKHLYIGNDNLANISVSKNKTQNEFIPYTDKKLNWHTDGYYNDCAHRVRSFTLFCNNPAKIGGKNHWLDIEILYILLRERSPDIIKYLSLIDAMTIPAHIKDNEILRAESTNAIFLIDKKTSSLYMRYTQRKKNIIFNPLSIESINELDEVLSINSPYHFSFKMESGQGIITNNVIHTRDSFENDVNNPRSMLRGRYFARI